MGKTLTWTILGVDKTSPAFKKIAKSADDASKKLDDFGIGGSKSLGGVADAAAKAKAAAEDMAVRMSSAVEKATDKLEKARQSEADQLGRLRIAKENLIALEEKGGGTRLQTARAEEAVAAAMRKVEAAQKAVVTGQEKLNNARDAAIAQARKEFDEANVKPKIDFDLKSGLEGVKKFAVSELKSAGIIAGAAMGAGIAAGLSTVGVAGMFIGIAAAAQSSNENVKRAYSTMWEQIKAGAQEASSVLADDFIAGAEKLGRTFNKLRPQMTEAFTASQPAVNDLFDGVDRLATQAMPGLVTAAKASALATDNVAAAMESTGRAVTNFLTEASKGAEAGGESIEAFGRIIERLGSFGGRILAELANSSTSVFPALVGAVDSAATAVENLAHTALPGLASGAALSLTGLSLLLNLANALVGALGPLAPHILTAVSALKLIDMLSFGGVSKSWDAFKTSIAEAPGLAGKAKAGFTGLIGTMGPWALAIAVGTAALSALSQGQQQAAERQQALTKAFRESKGAIDDNVRATVADTAAKEGLLQAANTLGISSSTFVSALLGEKDAIDNVNSAMEHHKSTLEDVSKSDLDNNETIRKKLEALTLLSGVQKKYGDDMRSAADAGKLYSEAMEKGAKGAEMLAEANKKAADELQKVRDQIDAMVNKDLAYRNSLVATGEAQGALAEAQKKAADELKAHGKNSKEFAGATKEVDDASRGLEGAFIAQAQAARDLAIANSLATDDLAKGKEGANAYTQEVIKMALAAGNNAPRALQMMAAKLTDADLQAIGARRHINELGQTVITLPDGKTITVRADDQASGVIRQIAGGRYVATIRLQADMSGYYRTVGQGSVLSGSSARGNAEGGWIKGPGTETSDSIPRMLSNNEFVVRAREAKKHGPLLEAINAGQPFPATGAGGGMSSGVSFGGNQPIVIESKVYVEGRQVGQALRQEIQRTTGGDSVRYFRNTV